MWATLYKVNGMQTASKVLSLIACVGSIAAEPAPVLVVTHQGEAASVAFSPDGKKLAAGSGYIGIIVWDSTTGKLLRSIDGTHVGDNVVFSPEGTTLASTRNWQQGEAAGIVHLWDSATGKRLGQMKGDASLIRCLAFSPDGKLLAAHSQGGGRGVGAVRVWDVISGKEVLNIPTNSAGHTIAFSPNGKLLAFDLGYSVRVCQAESGKELLKLEGHQNIKSNRGTTSGNINALTFSPDGKLIASASCDNMARIWDVATGKSLQVLEGHRGFVNTVAFFPDAKTIATGGEDGTIRWWQVTTGVQLGKIQAHGTGIRQDGDRRQDVFALSFSPDGKKLASGGRDTKVKVWDVLSLFQGR